MKIAFFGSSIVSAYWNGACTYYRGIVRALHERGHLVTFYEPDAFGRQQHRDIDDPEWAEVIVYDATPADALDALKSARGADLVVKASGVGVFDGLLEEQVLEVHGDQSLVVFWDVDAPATLGRVASDEGDPLRALIPHYDAVLTYGGGDPVVERYRALGARVCVPIYNALDPATHHPAPARAAFRADLSLLANRLPDREARIEEFFFTPARLLPHKTFLLGGAGWEEAGLPDNVRHIGHVPPSDHNAFNCSALAVLNVSRDSMAATGFSPATRVFEAAGAGACLITDDWEGIELFLRPDEEVLVARDGSEVAELLANLDEDRAARMGATARSRIASEHTYRHRAAQVEVLLEGLGDTA